MFAVCPMTTSPAFRNGGANGTHSAFVLSIIRIIAGTPMPRPDSRATST